jgi:nucleoside 2-deoxyribosyltransferase
MKIYFAAPCFSHAEREWNLKMANELTTMGHNVFLPQRDNNEGILENICLANIAAIRRCDFVVAIFDRSDPDSGTAWECGFAHAISKIVYAIRTDFRRGGDDARFEVNLMLSCTADVIFTDLTHFWTTMRSKL